MLCSTVSVVLVGSTGSVGPEDSLGSEGWVGSGVG